VNPPSLWWVILTVAAPVSVIVFAGVIRLAERRRRRALP
jgi:hypothetical protein